MEGGSYLLVLRHVGTETVAVGALGAVRFRDGYYVYAGSAFGPGGLGRVERHRRTAEEDDALHWHIDHLLVRDTTSVDRAVTVAGEDIECRLAQDIGGEPVEGFGCSDCDCDSHLSYFRDSEELEAAIARVTER